MSRHYYHGVCRQHIGQCVEIKCHDGQLHRGHVEEVDNEFVYIRPLNRNCDGPQHPEGPGMFFFGALAGGFLGGLLGVGLGSIAFFRPYPYPYPYY
ncbi:MULTISPECIES: hypothetical protein [Bacillales]|uniref:hypothetical protein n=1 Tax=Bacillales TaxID=1385 RepID=UPI001883D660|nr:hypothetical protein [Pseudalkalibacillus hwajinpoensis]MBF0706137.1 hypothetical protein [Pseudalkalibacillus hwajinpoensis]